MGAEPYCGYVGIGRCKGRTGYAFGTPYGHFYIVHVNVTCNFSSIFVLNSIRNWKRDTWSVVLQIASKASMKPKYFQKCRIPRP